MKRRQLELLHGLASQALDSQRQRVAEQQDRVTALEQALTRLDDELAFESASAGADPRRALLLPTYREQQRERARRLGEELATAATELDRRAELARQHFLDAKRHEILIARQSARERRVRERHEAAFLDEVAQRRRNILA